MENNALFCKTIREITKQDGSSFTMTNYYVVVNGEIIAIDIKQFNHANLDDESVVKKLTPTELEKAENIVRFNLENRVKAKMSAKLIRDLKEVK